MQRQIKQVADFCTAFNCTVSEKPTTSVPEEVRAIRVALLREEVSELEVACDIVGVLDALVDIMYVLIGTVHTYGLQSVIEDAFDEVHWSNMSKLDEHGKPVIREDGKVVKSAVYHPPRLERFVRSRQ